MTETLFCQRRVMPDEKVSRAAFGGQHSLRADQERLRDEPARLPALICDEIPAACAVRSSRLGFGVRGASASWR
jgi:hypothetical protein